MNKLACFLLLFIGFFSSYASASSKKVEQFQLTSYERRILDFQKSVFKSNKSIVHYETSDGKKGAPEETTSYFSLKVIGENKVEVKILTPEEKTMVVSAIITKRPDSSTSILIPRLEVKKIFQERMLESSFDLLASSDVLETLDRIELDSSAMNCLQLHKRMDCRIKYMLSFPL